MVTGAREEGWTGRASGWRGGIIAVEGTQGNYAMLYQSLLQSTAFAEVFGMRGSEKPDIWSSPLT